MDDKYLFASLRKTFCSLLTLIVLTTAGCSSLSYQCKIRAEEEFLQAQTAFRQQDYRKSLQECLSLISRYPSCSVYDRILYYTALNYLHLRSSPEDYNPALKYFQRLVDECPESHLVTESRTWITVLSALTATTDRAEEELRGNGTDTHPKRTGRISSDPVQKENDKKDQELKRLKHENEKLKHEIDLLKNVDVQLHQKKRGLNNAESGSD